MATLPEEDLLSVNDLLPDGVSKINKWIINANEPINTDRLTKYSVTTDILAYGSVTNSRMAEKSISESKLDDKSISERTLMDKAISPEKLKFNGAERNKGILYPLSNVDLGSVSNAELKNAALNALLDIKIHNAEPKLLYRLTYLAKNDIANFGDLILIDAFDSSGSLVRSLFSTKKKTYTYNPNGISTLKLKAENGDEMCYITIDYSLLADGSRYNFASTTYGFQNNRISQDNTFINSQTIKNTVDFNKEIGSVTIHGDAFSFAIEKFGINNIFALHFIYLSGSLILGSTTDWIGPYIVKAVNNGDPDAKRIFTGGTHSTENTNNTGKPTASTVRAEVYCDNKRLTSTGKYEKVNKVDVFVKNHIMGYNTIGTGRYILEENIHYIVDAVAGTINVEVHTVALEDIVIETYYGMQCRHNYFNSLDFVMGQYNDPQPIGNEIDSGPKSQYLVDTVVFTKNNSSTTMKMVMDNTIGLGLRDNVPDSSPCAHTTGTTKSYFDLISKDTPLPQYKKTLWKGYYEFKV
ncbi:hypothetical protein [Bacillus anthracis]|uniref:hypothetical protein n=1 Tax=Bacillus anthracis TaxID=1392 RepID=UPI003BA1AE3E